MSTVQDFRAPSPIRTRKRGFHTASINNMGGAGKADWCCSFKGKNQGKYQFPANKSQKKRIF